MAEVNSQSIALTPEQEAIVSLTDGAYLVVAPPGSGKTEVLAQRVVRLVQSAPDAGFKVLALSYTKNAAATMRRRVGDRLGEFTWRVVCTTYHAFCTDLLRSYGDLVGLPSDFTLYDTAEDQLQALAQGLVEEGVIGDSSEIDRAAALEALGLIGRLKRDLVLPTAAPDEASAQWSVPLSVAYRAYELALRKNGALDFDGVLVKAHELLRAQPELCAQYRRSYRYILIDEAQDTSTAQYEILRALCGDEHRNVLMVADPAQSIYAFAGASAQYIDAFQRDFGATRYVLGTTFRCGSEILRIAATLQPQSTKAQRESRAHAARAKGWVSFAAWNSERDEAVATVDWAEGVIRDGLPASSVTIEEQPSIRAEELAIVARSRNHLHAVLAELDERNVPYHFSTGEAGVFDTEEYTALLYGLKMLANERDVAVARSLIAHVRRSNAGAVVRDYDGILDDAAQLVAGLASDVTRTNMAVPFAALSDAAAGRDSMAVVLQRLADWDPSQDVADPDEADLLNADRELFRDRWIQYRNRPQSVQRGWHGVVLELVSTPRPEAPGVRVLTVHAAKGLEFRALAIIGLNDGSFPDFRNLDGKDIEGERRLMYVGVTRASRALWLSRPRMRQTRFGMRRQEPSRFLLEMGFQGTE
ncbi:MAG: ATP-dependent helicase [Chloroflexi bacterium]|nr:ATP-dependent helicase [Chloroflexota bacterium]